MDLLNNMLSGSKNLHEGTGIVWELFRNSVRLAELHSLLPKTIFESIASAEIKLAFFLLTY